MPCTPLWLLLLRQYLLGKAIAGPECRFAPLEWSDVRPGTTLAIIRHSLMPGVRETNNQEVVT